ncbi:hypothetical protein [Segetibacter sp.]|nr:hypothetical protein [Segetibacter sp.]MCW3078631.1 hypothetical protein [Segetibacter sp.]
MKQLILTIILAFFMSQPFSQSLVLKGTVADNNKGLLGGATIAIRI